MGLEPNSNSNAKSQSGGKIRRQSRNISDEFLTLNLVIDLCDVTLGIEFFNRGTMPIFLYYLCDDDSM